MKNKMAAKKWSGIKKMAHSNTRTVWFSDFDCAAI
jgi:hypothetical protein